MLNVSSFLLCYYIVFNDLDLPINISKSHCLRIGPRHDNPASMLKINEFPVHWVDNITFLGVTLCKARSFKCCWSEAKRKFYCSAVANSVAIQRGNAIACRGSIQSAASN